MGEAFSLKDALFNEGKITYLAELFEAADAGFDGAGFRRDVMAQMLSLELKQRIELIARVLARFLPEDYRAAVAVILAALPPPLDPSLGDNDFGDFIFGPLGEFVSTHGLADFETSMPAIKELTKRFSMEFTLRHFLNENEDAVMAVLADWVGDENYHVRRLVSEGTRPRLPWGKKVGLDLRAPLVFLDQLYKDKTRYVTRSVANHLNDIAKLEPELVCATLARWANEGGQDSAEMDWMTRHGLRTLIKAGDPGAMALLGYVPDPPVEASLSLGAEAVFIGDVLPIAVEIRAQEATDLLVDYAVAFVKANGARKPKVFKMKQVRLAAGQSLTINKKHRFKGDASTFRLYPGAHRIVLQINGVERGCVDFTLVERGC